jgi:Endonuclease NucS C-terminal domain
MPTTMALWRLGDGGSATPIVEERLAAEALIESAVESAPELLGDEVLIVGRQVHTPSGPLDLLALDTEGHLVVIENKRDRTPRDVLAQAIDYAAYISTITFDEVAAIYDSYCLRRGLEPTDLAEDYEERFGAPLDTITDPPRMIIVASRLDDSTERMIGFLADVFGVPVNAALFQPFAGGLIGRTWLRPEEPSRVVGRSAANVKSQEESKVFWDAWLPIGRAALPTVTLPANGPRNVYITRGIARGVPATVTVWVSSAEAFAEVAFRDDDPAMNELLLTALKDHQTEIESAFGGPLEWRAPEGPMKVAKVVTPKVSIGSRSEPTGEGLHGLADVASRLLKAVEPYLRSAYDSATLATAERESDEAQAAETDVDLGGDVATRLAPDPTALLGQPST